MYSLLMTYVSSSFDIIVLTTSHCLVGHLGWQLAPEADHEKIFSLKNNGKGSNNLLASFKNDGVKVSTKHQCEENV